MKKIIFVGFLFMCGVVFYYVDPMQLFSVADDKLNEIVDDEFDLDTPEKEVSSQYQDPFQQTIQNRKFSDTALDEESTSQSIINKYKGTLLDLKKQVEEKLNQLLEEAHQEYKQGDSANLPGLYLKYNQAIQELEHKTDESFQEVYQQLQEELKANGYDPDKAETVKEEYEQIKKETRSVMTERVMEKFEV
ncbi:hypothetical protein GWK91_10240 [Virgibacillus sp. MSP4-1]|uniref:hypothetical protein n=1 Tax=Virgibacillus sp. MSP4-1 TaxID=2700081 RepID=UPI0003A508F0|nr:hypothetical protein [Virgibacillus sp. MSP4-1]QHS23305.1 hypothetical protein GWK91_10240 [Virgibacillus sp. MSP4-1]